MKWLLLDTSCPQMVVALCIDNTLVAARYSLETKKHSELLSPIVDELLTQANLKMSELNGVAVGKGPGSFIGSRIAIAYAKGICVALDIPLVGVGTLASLANSPSLPKGKGIAVIDARRGEYYVQHFERPTQESTVAIDAPHLFPASELSVLSRNCDFVVGTSLRALEPSFESQCIEAVDGPSADGMFQAFLSKLRESRQIRDETESLVPEYVRDPDAKPMPS